MTTIKGRITVKVVTGETFQTSWSEESAEAEDAVRDFLSRISEMTKLDIETEDGLKIYINPAHVVYAYLETEEV